MSEQDWTEAVDGSELIEVLPMRSLSRKGGITVEFIAIEIRGSGGVLTLRVIDEQKGGDLGDGPPDFVVPVLQLRSADGRAFEVVVVANDFTSLASVRHRAVFRPRPDPGVVLNVIITDFELGESQASSGPWESADVVVTP